MVKEREIALFEKKRVRRVWHKQEWWFVVEDIVLALIDSHDPKQYISKMRKRDPQLAEGWVQFVHTLKVKTEGGEQLMNCSNTSGALRIIQSIPSPKAEPFKQWLARIGKDRIDEINNPELAMERMKALYEKKGYTKDWIEKRSRGIAVRQELTTEWKERGIKNSREFAILTNEIMQGTFEMKVGEYKSFKGLEKENLRDHMNDLELILTMLAEATTTKLHQERDSQGLNPVRNDAKEGGQIAGNTRKQIEKASGAKISTRQNHLPGKRKIRISKQRDIK